MGTDTFPDKVMDDIGGFGRYQVFIILLMTTPSFMLSLATLSSTFYTRAPEFRCSIPEWGANDSYSTWMFEGQNVTDFVPLNDEGELKKCRLMENGTTGGETRCSEYVYDSSMFGNTIVLEFELFCDERAALSTTSSTLNLAGYMVGSVIGGMLSDAYGRKKAAVIMTFFQAATTIGTAFSVNIYMFMALRFFVGAFGISLSIIVFGWRAEIISTRWRIFAMVPHQYMWVVGSLVIVLIAYFVRDWYITSLIIGCLPLIQFLTFWYLIPESPRWLASKGRLEESTEVLKMIGRRNGKPLPDDFTLQPVEKISEEPEVEEKLTDLFKSKRLLLHCLVLAVNWFACSMGYYGLSFSAVSLVGDPYVNSVISALVEIPAYTLTFAINFIGRKKFTVGSQVIGGLFVIASGVIHIFYPEEIAAIITTNMLGKMGVSFAFTMAYVWTAELVPTTLRTTLMGICSMFGRVGGLLAPLWADLGNFVPGIAPQMITPGVIGGTLVVAGLLSLLLPETTGNPLPETIAQANAIGRKLEQPSEVHENNNASSRYMKEEEAAL